MPTRHDRRRSADRPDAIAKTSTDPEGALADVETADAAYGTVPLELLARAKKLRRICASPAPGSAVPISTMRWQERCRRDRHARRLTDTWAVCAATG
jgi:hypothetical protein